MNKKTVKSIIIGAVALLIIIFIILIYNNIFVGSNNNRYEGIEKHKLTNNEINSVESAFKSIDGIKKVNVYTNNKIINIMLVLKEDVPFDKIKEVSNVALSNFDEDNLAYYDVQLFIDSLNEESEEYPKIGYKFKSNNEFTW